MLDVGIAPRQFAAARNLFLSHGHADHIGALGTLMGLRGLNRLPPPRVFLPAEIEDNVRAALGALSAMQRYPLDIDAVPLRPGEEAPLGKDTVVRAFRTHHPVPSLGYQVLRRVEKLKPAFKGLPGPEIARRRRAGEALFQTHEHLEVAYATDTLVRVLDTAPEILRSRVLILECSFLDERKTLQASRAGCHIHLDELLDRADSFENEALVLMHFSQLYPPAQVHEILETRCPKHLLERLHILCAQSERWPL